MGKLVKFEPPPKKPADGEPPLGTAQILIFTGVFYERGTPPPHSSLDPTRPKTNRG